MNCLRGRILVGTSGRVGVMDHLVHHPGYPAQFHAGQADRAVVAAALLQPGHQVLEVRQETV